MGDKEKCQKPSCWGFQLSREPSIQKYRSLDLHHDLLHEPHGEEHNGHRQGRRNHLRAACILIWCRGAALRLALACVVRLGCCELVRCAACLVAVRDLDRLEPVGIRCITGITRAAVNVAPRVVAPTFLVFFFLLHRLASCQIVAICRAGFFMDLAAVTIVRLVFAKDNRI